MKVVRNSFAMCRVVKNSGEIIYGVVGMVFGEDGASIPVPSFSGFSGTFKHDHSDSDGVAVYLEMDYRKEPQ